MGNIIVPIIFHKYCDMSDDVKNTLSNQIINNDIKKKDFKPCRHGYYSIFKDINNPSNEQRVVFTENEINDVYIRTKIPYVIIPINSNGISFTGIIITQPIK